MKKINAKKGFTIIEMVIVIAIIGILAAVLIPTYGNVIANANESAAMQTARSTMTNWLANSTSSAGVPTSGKDAKGNDFYAAYFEFQNGDSGQLYQFRYTSGGVERTDNNPSQYVNFSMVDKEIPGLTLSSLPKYIDKAYLTTPKLDTGMAGNEEKYAVSIYKQIVGGSTNYYVKYGAKSAYTCGGADVYAAVGAATPVYIKDETTGEYTKFAIADLTTFESTENNGEVPKIVYTVTISQSTASLIVTKKLTLNAETTPAGAIMTWTSDDTNVATVDANGVVTAVAAGSAKITVTVTNEDETTSTASCTVTVTTE